MLKRCGVIWTIDYTTDAQKSIRKLDHQIRQRIRSYLQERIAHLDDPRQTGEALQGSELGSFWRYRVGDYRVICDIQDSRVVIIVVEVGHRREIYR